MVMADFGNMILAMVRERNALAVEAAAIEGSDDGDSTERAAKKRDQIQGMHKMMEIAIRTMENSFGITFEQWKKMQADHDR